MSRISAFWLSGFELMIWFLTHTGREVTTLSLCWKDLYGLAYLLYAAPIWLWNISFGGSKLIK